MEYDERLLSVEAKAAVKEVAFAVKTISISQTFPNSEDAYHLNLETLEDKKYCVELTVKGFRIINSNACENSEYYETIYSLLDAMSPQYRVQFSSALSRKLSEIEQGHTVNTDA